MYDFRIKISVFFQAVRKTAVLAPVGACGFYSSWTTPYSLHLKLLYHIKKIIQSK